MVVDNLKELYLDYLISSTGQTTCTGLSNVLDGAVSHDKFTRMLATADFDSKTLWKQNKIMAYSKVEILKIRAKSNEHALKRKIYYNALKIAMKQIEELSTNTKLQHNFKNCA